MKRALQSYDLHSHLERCLELTAQRTAADRTTVSLAFMRTSVVGRRLNELRDLEAITGYAKLAESMLIEQYCQEHRTLPKHVELMKSRIQLASNQP
jgi:hypothetical protein